MKIFPFIHFARIAACIITAAGLLAACSEDFSEGGNADEVIYTFEAVQAEAGTDSNPTRTVIYNETAVYWSPKDSIKIFSGTKYSGKFTGTNSEPSASTKFKGKFSQPGGQNIVIGGDTQFFGLYPYSSSATGDDTSVTMTLPSDQSAMDGTFAPNLFPSLAKSNGPNLTFHNICGGVMFTVSQSGITSVTFRGNNGESLSGTAKVAMNDEGKPEVKSFTEAGSVITVTAPDGGSFKSGVKYYIAAFPASLTGGYSITFNKSGLTATYTSSSAVTIKRSVFGKLENKDSGLSFVPASGNITFADAIAKSACVAKYDTDKDGEISYAEAAAVTSLDNLFKNYTGVTSFEELKYFINVTDLKGAFNGCTSLVSVTIPENIIVIGNNAFKGCTSLETITIPGTVTNLGNNAFSGCSSLSEITLPSSVTSIGANCFDSGLTTVYMSGTTPPTINNGNSFNAGTVIYVPASALETYKSSWSAYKAYIKAIMGGANCFVISSYSQQVFDSTKKGNSEESVGETASAEVLWESFGTETAPTVGDIVSGVSYRDGKVFFTASGKDGNAVIAVKDSEGNILWSWHIWVCKDYDPEASAQIYNNDAGTMMDRNLGAISATPGDLGALGLLYQWGRKDPFLGNNVVDNNGPYGNSAASTIEWPNNTASKASNGTIAYTIANPTRFISNDTLNKDWYYTGNSTTDNTRWQNTKTMYDPCPAGWKVPEGGSGGVWAKAFGSNSTFSKGPWNSTYKGMNFGSGNGKDSSMQLGEAETIWYPAAGCRSYNTSGLKWPGSNCYCWTTTPADADTAACSFFFQLTGEVIPSSSRERAAARSVRCIQE